ncbi:hypothetical protein FEM48_Zijuj02G0173300 [Ziziphus jujuba var. spinosa]|uniref:Ammonium transporter AmtB-like domain-containing protein n=1 Tax=Ziziphus jujuba var. spinosa TaxID=714518 RepID=A0A978VWY9_ZIZJJ|nr:hypothetical protein FEM48_Zijuj02G0173300 [Ziziphus jujuba var. spinosa]
MCFAYGDLVLTIRRTIVITRKMQQKFKPKWEGPYIANKSSNPSDNLVVGSGVIDFAGSGCRSPGSVDSRLMGFGGGFKPVRFAQSVKTYDDGRSYYGQWSAIGRTAHNNIGRVHGGSYYLIQQEIIGGSLERHRCLQRLLGGFAAITSGCSVVEPWAAIICGFRGGMGSDRVQQGRREAKIRTTLSRQRSFTECGAWGLLFTGLFAKEVVRQRGLLGDREEAVRIVMGGAEDCCFAMIQVLVISGGSRPPWDLFSMFA